MDERIEVAYHEAGHAVAAVVLNIGFHSATIVPDAERESLGTVDYGGRTALLNLHHRSYRRELRDLLISNRAGQLAATRATGQPPNGTADDDERFWSTLYQMYGERRERHAADLTSAARKLVAQHWSAIERVAAALQKQQTLTGDAIEQLVSGTTQAEYQVETR